jgi:hypothetical protein
MDTKKYGHMSKRVTVVSHTQTFKVNLSDRSVISTCPEVSTLKTARYFLVSCEFIGMWELQ